MPQNGIHAIAGVAVRKWMPNKEWLLLGVVLGNMAPDLDNIVVAYATLAKLPDPESYHRTFTHSLLTVAVMAALFYLVAAVTKNQKWNNFGAGFGTGILMHILLDLALWFNGVPLLWPLNTYETNFWSWFVTPPWLKILLDTGEFLAFGLYFALLGSLTRRNNTDVERLGSLRIWQYVQFVLFVLFTFLFFVMPTIPLLYTIFGALYLVSLIAAMVISIRMRKTLETL
jgi:membrane-bound metal-dependent hydrolase YbcI (DUF457 family)